MTGSGVGEREARPAEEVAEPRPRAMSATLGRLLLEMAGVIFAVLVALGADAWWEDRELGHRAALARSAVVEELRSNREELASSTESLDGTAAVLAQAAEDIAVGGSASFNLRLLLPDFSDAAWRITQGTDAASRIDLAWLIRIARVHESQETYSRISGQVLETMTDLRVVGHEAIPRLAAQLETLRQIHAQLLEDYDEALAAEAGAEGGG